MAKTLSIRGVDEVVARQFAAGAAVRGITQAEYLKLLLECREVTEFALSPLVSEEAIRGYYRRTKEWFEKNNMGSQYA